MTQQQLSNLATRLEATGQSELAERLAAFGTQRSRSALLDQLGL